MYMQHRSYQGFILNGYSLSILEISNDLDAFALSKNEIPVRSCDFSN